MLKKKKKSLNKLWLLTENHEVTRGENMITATTKNSTAKMVKFFLNNVYKKFNIQCILKEEIVLIRIHFIAYSNKLVKQFVI